MARPPAAGKCQVATWDVRQPPACAHGGVVHLAGSGVVRPDSVLLLSLEPWDEVWRRNQHLAHEVVRQRYCERLVFVNPPARKPAVGFHSAQRITVLTPPLSLPPRFGGLGLAARWIQHRVGGTFDFLWINHAVLGAHLLDYGMPSVYDVTDDWRLARNSERARRRWVAAEDRLAHSTRTIVCSLELQRRWASRYGVQATVVQNGVDRDAVAHASARVLPGSAPHVGYVGTLQAERVDVDLVLSLSHSITGTVHLVGPDHFEADDRTRLASRDNIVLHGAVPGADVPSWLVAFDVLLVPHIVSDFTMSLDAIKAHEYLATTRPIVATPSSGFQDLSAPGLTVVSRDAFVDGVCAVLNAVPDCTGRKVASWEDRAAEFAKAAWGAA